MLNHAYATYQQRDTGLASWLLVSICPHVNIYFLWCMTLSVIWSKVHQMFSSYSTTRVMSLFGILKPRKMITQPIRDYLADIQSTCDRLASCGQPIDEMQQITIILYGVKGQFDNVVLVIHASRNSYD